MSRPIVHNTTSPRRLVIDFPLRPDFAAQFVLPYDLTTQEAKRIGAMLETLPNASEAKK